MKWNTNLYALTVALVMVAGSVSSAFASPAPYLQDLARVTYPNGVVTPDSSQFTIEFSNASTLATTDTLQSFYIGGLNQQSSNGPTNALTNAFRVVVRGVPQLVAGDTLYAYTDFSTRQNGPWFTQKATVAPPIILLNGLGAAAADTVGVGTWLTYGSFTTGGSNSVFPTPNVWAGFMQLNPTLASLTAGGVMSPTGWLWCRLRLSGDHGASAPVYGASVSVVVPSDVTPAVSPGPRQ